ncbi:mitochondrial intermembrane space import and assembly protein 40 isoform X1 [Mycteria americana]|uniref:mitochondrial intermembrane space import and assembly protein 40 isoform X1 n=1 Tax=Mycteria americana TaxID=33587 RepID=UPI003F583485
MTASPPGAGQAGRCSPAPRPSLTEPAAPSPAPALGPRPAGGKDRIIFATKEDHETPSSAELVADDPDDPYEEQGLILPNGDINWNCPCLGGMASGPCGEQFKSAFSCFHYSTEEIKGSDCVDQFRAMQECMQKYPDLYPQEDENEEKEKSSKDLEATPMEASAAKEEKGSS